MVQFLADKIKNDPTLPRRGLIERAGRFLGLAGWVEDPARPGLPIELEVLAEDQVILGWRAEPIPRAASGPDGRIRFHIPRAALQTEAAAALRGMALPLRLRFAGGETLASIMPLPPLSDMLDAATAAATPPPPPAPPAAAASMAATPVTTALPVTPTSLAPPLATPMGLPPAAMDVASAPLAPTAPPSVLPPAIAIPAPAENPAPSRPAAAASPQPAAAPPRLGPGPAG
ncbi:hypothetical protein JYK14_20185, partial [Siccirubricoccus sp. KC 17139]|nr:hypothetical protein [Siccirubricoccus soli]MCP2684599.1 hypothetical protein [Siccirubricoccus soli]